MQPVFRSTSTRTANSCECVEAVARLTTITGSHVAKVNSGVSHVKNLAGTALALAAMLLLPQPSPADSFPVVLGEEELTKGIPGVGPLTNEQIAARLEDETSHQTLTVTLPLGLSAGQTQMKGPMPTP